MDNSETLAKLITEVTRRRQKTQVLAEELTVPASYNAPAMLLIPVYQLIYVYILKSKLINFIFLHTTYLYCYIFPRQFSHHNHCQGHHLLTYYWEHMAAKQT